MLYKINVSKNVWYLQMDNMFILCMDIHLLLQRIIS